MANWTKPKGGVYVPTGSDILRSASAALATKQSQEAESWGRWVDRKVVPVINKNLGHIAAGKRPRRMEYGHSDEVKDPRHLSRSGAGLTFISVDLALGDDEGDWYRPARVNVSSELHDLSEALVDRYLAEHYLVTTLPLRDNDRYSHTRFETTIIPLS